ncbi:MAG: hypothetical protein JKP90_16365 [Desulfofustis sp. PB-SRB1]|nr:hypothetical protein [Desulfofustis sp. PB-SRB1]
MTPKLRRYFLSALCLTVPLASHAADNPLAKYLEIPGAKTTLPISSANRPFPWISSRMHGNGLAISITNWEATTPSTTTST